MNVIKQIYFIAIFFACAGEALFAQKTKKAACVICSYDRPMQLYAFLSSIDRHIKNIGCVYVIYRASDERFLRSYEDVQLFFQNVVFCRQGSNPHADFKELILKSTFESLYEYVIFGVDDIVVKDSVDIAECIEIMEETGAYGFYLRLGLHIKECYTCNCMQKIPPYIRVKNNVYKWRFRDGCYDWAYPNTVDMTLYRKKDIKSDLTSLSYTTPNTLEGNWYGRSNRVMDKFGLFFDTSKIVNIPLNRVQTNFKNRNMDFLSVYDLLALFEQGLSIDIDPLYKIVNNSPHIEYLPTFVRR